MSLHIIGSGLSSPDTERNSVDHSAKAGLAALDAAGIGGEDVDLLVNIGVYRHHNLCEPSVCALIQHEMDLCKGFGFDGPSGKLVFSFDLNNGACGLTSAIATIQAVMKARGLRYALIVGSDSHPSGEVRETFPFTALGTALALEWKDAAGGFSSVIQRTTPAEKEGQVGGCDIEIHGTASRTTIDIDRDADYADALLDFAATVADDALQGVERAGLKLLCSEPDASFAPKLAERLGLDADAAITMYPQFADTHTSAVALAWHHHPLKPGERALVVNAGGGLTVGCVLYEA